MKIKITRKPGNVRVGSRAWAASLPADKWTWRITRFNHEIDMLCIYNDNRQIAALSMDNDTRDTNMRENIEYGGMSIGHALLSDLQTWMDSEQMAEAIATDNIGGLTVENK